MSKIPHFPSGDAVGFSRRFRLLMAWHDLTLREIASATNNALSTVGTWKNGRRPASWETLARLAEIFHVPVEYLLTGQLREVAVEADDTASRILDDLDLLTRALEHGSTFRETSGKNKAKNKTATPPT